jgi:hypothetical protein
MRAPPFLELAGDLAPAEPRPRTRRTRGVSVSG